MSVKGTLTRARAATAATLVVAAVVVALAGRERLDPQQVAAEVLCVDRCRSGA